LRMMIFPPSHRELEKGHGRIERREIKTSTALTGYTLFPHLGQVFRLDRWSSDLQGRNPSHETRYGVTSLSPEKANSERILELVRRHWRIENSLHWVRDVTFDEDRSQVRTGAGPRMMASLRNFAISLLRLLGFDNIAGALRALSWKPNTALQVLGL